MFASLQGKGQPKVSAARRYAAAFMVAALMVAGMSLVLASAQAYAQQNTAQRAFASGLSSIDLAGATISLQAEPLMAQSLLAGSLDLEEGEHLLFLSIDLKDGWKTYWRLPGRFGLAPTLDWTASDNLAQVETLFPRPVLFDEGDGTSIGYKASTLWPVRLRIEDTSQPATLRLMLDIGLCEALCLPERVELTATLPAGEQTPQAQQVREAPLAAIIALADQLPTAEQPLAALSLDRQDEQVTVAFADQGRQASEVEAGRGFAVAEDGQGRHSLLVPLDDAAGEVQSYGGPWRWPSSIHRITFIDPAGGMHIFADGLPANQ